MKIELKNIRHFFALTDETNAFSANLYINNILVAGCSDTGKGGCIDIRAVKGKETLLKEAGEYAKSLPPEISTIGDEEFELKMDLEFYISQLVNKDIAEREFKKAVKKNEKYNIVYGKDKEDLNITWYETKDGKKVLITDILSQPKSVQKLADYIAELKQEGNIIFNTNIPRGLIDKSPKK